MRRRHIDLRITRKLIAIWHGAVFAKTAAIESVYAVGGAIPEIGSPARGRPRLIAR